MKILYNIYIFSVIFTQGRELNNPADPLPQAYDENVEFPRSENSPKKRPHFLESWKLPRPQGASASALEFESRRGHQLSRKLNPAECPGLLGSGQQAATRLSCLGRLWHWRDKLPDNSTRPSDSLRSVAHVSSSEPNSTRSKREARMPARFLPTELVLQRNHHHSRRKTRRHAAGRLRRRRRRKKKKKRKRRQPAVSPAKSGNATDASPNGELPVIKNTKSQENPSEKASKFVHHPGSKPTAGQVIFTVLLCLLGVIVSCLLLFCLHRKIQKRKPIFESFKKPAFFSRKNSYNTNGTVRTSSGTGKSPDNLWESDCCTCGRSTRPSTRSAPSEHHPDSWEKCKSKKTPASSAHTPPGPAPTKAKEKKVKKKPPTPPKKRTRFSDVELDEIQSRIAHILRQEGGRCDCCKCDAVPAKVKDPPRKKGKFKFFKKKKNNKVCNDYRCNENKIRDLTNLCDPSKSYDSRFASCETTELYSGGRYKDPPTKNKGKLKVKK